MGWRSILITSMVLSMAGLTACGSSDDDDDDTTPAGTSQTDITDATLTRTSGDCSNYVGSYISNVTDITRAVDFTGDIVITADTDSCTIQSNDIPNHDFNDATASFATNASEQSLLYTIVQSPVAAAASTALGIGTTEGVFLNGVSLDILPAACYGVGDEPLGQEKIGCGADQNENPWRYDPMSSLNSFGTDTHNAHVQPTGAYHYHGNPVAMFVQDCTTATTVSAVIGFAADGFPIYGSCIMDTTNNQIRAAVSGYILKDNGGVRQAVAGYTTPVSGVGNIATGNYDGQFRGDWEHDTTVGDLDTCNGMTVDGQYGYYVTSTFPWVINCFKGSVNDSFGPGRSGAQQRMHTH